MHYRYDLFKTFFAYGQGMAILSYIADILAESSDRALPTEGIDQLQLASARMAFCHHGAKVSLGRNQAQRCSQDMVLASLSRRSFSF